MQQSFVAFVLAMTCLAASEACSVGADPGAPTPLPSDAIAMDDARYGDREEDVVREDATPSDAVAESGIDAGVMAVSVGYDHVCGLDRIGARCWGFNQNGQVGDGSFTDRWTPTKVALDGISDVFAVHSSTCAIVIDGTLRCWGHMTTGQLGDGVLPGPNKLAVPTTVPGIAAPVQVGGGAHLCALFGDGRVKCWGDNFAGQLGYVTKTPCGGDLSGTCSAVPTAVPEVDQVTILAFGERHTCVRRQSGDVRCWGANNFGQLGDGTQTDSLAPRTVLGLPPAKQLSASVNSSCALTLDGRVFCWGARQRSTFGTVGEPALTPYPIAGFSTGVAEVRVGGAHACTRMTDGTVQCWGRNQNGRLGNPALTDPVVTTPATVPGLKGVKALSVGANTSCALTVEGALWCWGARPIGDGTDTLWAAVPTRVIW